MAAEQPNVVLIYFDDMGYGDMGANGASGVNIPADSRFLDPAVQTLTPNLDPSPEIRAKEQELHEILNAIRGDAEWGKENQE